MIDPHRIAPPPFDVRREGSETGWPNQADAGGMFAAAGHDSGIQAYPSGGDSGGHWGYKPGDTGLTWIWNNSDGGQFAGGPAGDWSWLGSAAAGDMMALYPGAHMDHGMLEIPFGPDSATPAYLTLDATGAVGADFSGHVKATGLDLSADVVATVPNSIRWIRASDGVVVVRQDGFVTAAGAAELNQRVTSPSGTRTARIVTDASDIAAGTSSVKVEAVNGASDLTAALISDVGSDYAGLCLCRASNNANIACANAADTILTLNTEQFDVLPGALTQQHDPVTNSSRLTCRVAGTYLIHGQVNLANNAVGVRQVKLLLNGLTDLANHLVQAVNGQETRLPVTTMARLIVGDFVEMSVFQTSGAALNALTVGTSSPALMWVRVGP